MGPLIATAVFSKVGYGTHFKNGREMAAYIGLVPRQYSTGGKHTLLGISKRGDRYVRGLLIHGARAAIHSSKQMSDKTTKWVQNIIGRRGMNKAIVALANKNARILWALIRKEESYQSN